jgi:lysophospholipase L1-like esterase
MNNSKKYLTGKFFSTLLVIILLFVSAEFVLRERAKQRFGEVKATYYVKHPVLGKVLKPNFVRTGKNGSMRINSYGFRGEEFTKLPSADVVRFFVLGDSVVFGGNGVEDEGGIWPEALQRELNNLSTGKRVEIINAGVPGWGSFQVLWNFENRILDFKPQIVLIYAMPGEISGVVKKDKPAKVAGMGSINVLQGWHKKNSIFYDLLKLNTKELRADTAAGTFVTFPETAQQGFYNSYQKLVRACKKNGVVPVLITAAHPFRKDQPLEKQMQLFKAPFYGLGLDGAYQAFAALNGALKQLAEDEDVLFVDLENSLPITGTTFLDNIHFAPDGHRSASKFLAAQLNEKLLHSLE